MLQVVMLNNVIHVNGVFDNELIFDSNSSVDDSPIKYPQPIFTIKLIEGKSIEIPCLQYNTTVVLQSTHKNYKQK